MGCYWIAYSGGIDSTVLLYTAATLWRAEGKVIKAIHVHHGLSKHADQWAEHCQHIAQQLTIPLVIKRLQGQPQKGDSVEAWARTERRAAFAEVMQEGDVIVTAQHADDQAETVLLQLMRGAGPEGLSAMPVWSVFANGQQWRPFLTLTKTQLLDYAQHHHLSWIEDDSNQDQRFDRNFIRQHVMPLLAQRWSAVVPTLGRVAQNCADAQQFIDQHIQQQLVGVTDCLRDIEQHPRLQQIYLLRAWLKQCSGHAPSRIQLQQLFDNVIHAVEDANPMMPFGAGEVHRFQANLYWVRPQAVTEFEQAWNGEQPLTIPGRLEPLTKDRLRQAGLPVDQLDWSHITVRFRRGGERCKPKGRAHSQTLKKLLQEYQVPPWQRDHLPLIFYHDQLVMVVGSFLCEIG